MVTTARRIQLLTVVSTEGLVVTTARRIQLLTVVLVVTIARRIRLLTVVSTSIHRGSVPSINQSLPMPDETEGQMRF